jgi:hypothetical protein
MLLATRQHQRGTVHNTSPKARFLKFRYFGFRGNAQFVCLAQPEGLGPRFNKELRGPTARPFALCWHPRHHKLPDLRP